ncbi:aTP-dependent Clp protease ATP-binding subunit ClpX [Mycoplasma sp. CAG:877]|nr:aTP-dependent Clp protease ATP-binding subunit ClpX [Mycoplasma sp. CAG:877]
MSEKVVVTLMKKRKITNECSVFTVSSTRIGYYDPRVNLFYDNKTKGCYPNIRNVASYKKDNTLAFDNLVRYDDLEQAVVDGGTFNDALKRYTDDCKRHFYVVISRDGVNSSVITLNVDDFEDATGKIKDISALISGISRDKDNRGLLNMDVDEALLSLRDMITDGGRSKEDLELLKNELLYYRSIVKELLNLVAFEMNGVRDNELDDSDTVSVEKVDDGSKKVILSDINIDELVGLVTKTVVHQDDAVRRLVLEIERNLESDGEKDGILITGSTGVGKTMTINLIAKYLDRPVKIIDSTQLTVPGYVGKSVEDYLYELLCDCNGDVERAEQAIIFFDEIDKKGSEKKSDISGQGVLNVLLKFLDGTEYDVTSDRRIPGSAQKISTKNMLVLAGGSFADVYKNSGPKQIGFLDGEKKEYVPSATDFVEKGMMTKDFIGRFPIIIHYNDLDAKALVDVLVNSEASPLKRERDVFSKAGVKLTVTEDYMEAVARAAINMETGARGLKGIVKNTTWPSYDKVKSESGVYREVVLDEKTVSDNKVYVLRKKDD